MTDLHDGNSRALLRQEAIDWLIRLRSDDLGADELNGFAEWLARDAAHVAAFAEAEQLFSDMTVAAAHPARLPSIPARSRSASSMRQPRFGKFRRRFLYGTSAVAACLWALAVSLVPMSEWHWQDAFSSDYRTAIGEIREITLADGSTAILDTHSAISADFTGSARRITLHHGRVHVQVKADPRRPFEIDSGDVIVRALGTAFDTRRLDGYTQVTVQEHAVSVRLANASAAALSPVTVREGQRLTHQHGEHLPSPESVLTAEASAWQHKRLMVSDRPLQELIDELAKYRIGRILLADDALKSQRVSGVFDLDHPEQAVQALCVALNLKATAMGPWWTLLHR